MSKKFIAGIALALFGVVVVLSKPLNLKEVRAQVGPVSSPISAQLFRAIYGTVKVISTPLTGVKVVLVTKVDGQKVVREAITDSLGSYSFKFLDGNTYVVGPKDKNYTFSPQMQSVNLPVNCPGICAVQTNFQGTPR